MLVYIAAPYADPTPEGIRWNIARASLMGRLAFEMGHTPIVPHVLGAALFGTDETPQTRADALRYGLDLVRDVARAGGDLWVLTRDDGTLSDGCAAEVARFQASAPRTTVLSFTWPDHGPVFVRHGLGAEWERLSVRP